MVFGVFGVLIIPNFDIPTIEKLGKKHSCS